MADNFSDVSDIFNYSGSVSESDIKDSIITRRQNKTVHSFSDYSESGSSDDDNNDI